MSITFTADDGVTTISFASQAAREAAERWYNCASKGDIVAYCESRGLNLHRAPGTMVTGWADIAMQFWARNDGARGAVGPRAHIRAQRQGMD